jgi:hypothetical protein
MPRVLTNKFGLPDTLVRAVAYDNHVSAGTISVTELIDGPRIRILKKQYKYESDVSDNLYALMGSALHHVLERANISSVRKRAFILTAETLIRRAEEMSKEESEESADKAAKIKAAANWLFAVIPTFFPETKERYIFEKTLTLTFGDQVLSGTFDLYDKEEEILYDYKFCSVYQYIFPESRKKWAEQANIYAYMLKENGFKVKKIRIVAFFRDWSHHGFMKNQDYPIRQVMEIDIQVFPTETTHSLIEKYMDAHNRAERGDIDPCSGGIRWAKTDTFAVRTPKSRRAIKVFDTRPLMEMWIEENRHLYANLVTEIRPGGSMRCEKYCPVSKYCTQYALEQQSKVEE